MSEEASVMDEEYPTLQRLVEVQTFLVELESLKTKLESKKAEAQKVIKSKMSDLHQLIDKWETRFLDTMAETLDEKIEGVAKQQEKLKTTMDWIQEQSRSKRLSRVFPTNLRTDNPTPVTNEADTEEGLQNLVELPGEEDEETEKPEEELAKKHWRIWKSLNFPLQPAGVSVAEVNVDLWNEFGQLLEESRKSLKRSFLFVGGIVRAYMRRGHKKDEWVAMVRRLEARTEANNPTADHSLDAGLIAAPSSSASLGNSAIFSTIWMAISDTYKYRNVPSVRGPLSKQLNYMYTNYPVYVEFYLPQLVNLMLCFKDFPLTDFIFERCRSDLHFAIQTYFLASSMSQVGSAKWQKRCMKTLKHIIKAIPVAQGGKLPSFVSIKSTKDPHVDALLVIPPQSNTKEEMSHLNKTASTSGSNQETPDSVLASFPLELPTDNHNLMLLFSPRVPSTSTIISANIPSSDFTEIRKSMNLVEGDQQSSAVPVRRMSPIPFPHLGSQTQSSKSNDDQASSPNIDGYRSDRETKSNQEKKSASPRGPRSGSQPSSALKNNHHHHHQTTQFAIDDHSHQNNQISNAIHDEDSHSEGNSPTSNEEILDDPSRFIPVPRSETIAIPSNIGGPEAFDQVSFMQSSTPSLVISAVMAPTQPPPEHLYLYSPSSSPNISDHHFHSHPHPVSKPAKSSNETNSVAYLCPDRSSASHAGYQKRRDSASSSSSSNATHLLNAVNRSEKKPKTSLEDIKTGEKIIVSSHDDSATVESTTFDSSSNKEITSSNESESGSGTETSTDKAKSDLSDNNGASSTTSNSPPLKLNHENGSSRSHLMTTLPKSANGAKADGHSSEYNSDDPEEELRRLTRITKPPQAPRVEKNLEVPVGKEYFFAQVKFMRKLIDVSRKLGELYGKPDTYKPSLDRELEALTPYISSGYAYMPHTNGVRTRVLRFVLPDCHPIPTYGRVLYKMIIEVVDLPAHYTKEMADEYVRLNKDFMRVASQWNDALPQHSLQTTGLVRSSSSAAIVSKEQRSDSPPGRALHGEGLAQSMSSPNLTMRSTSAFGESWKDVRRRIKASSQFSALPHWDVRAYIVKHGDLVLQEQFVMQLLVQFQHVFELEGLPLKLCCYNIMATSYQSGLIEVVPNSISLDKLKKMTEINGGASLSLLEFFKKEWPASEDFKRARSNFVASLAAYSVVCYLLQIKDRHNGNIMLDADGNIFHIDFGYLLSRTIKFEKAPFKLTDEFIEVMGGDQSKSYKAYCNLCVLGFLAARKHYEKILLLVEMSVGEGAAIPCLETENISMNLRKRFHLEWSDAQCEEYILGLIGDARDNWRTQIYDTYQRIVNDIH